MTEFLATNYLDPLEIVIRLVLAAALGFLVGFDRSAKNKPLGFRPFMLVALGSCLVSMIILELGSGAASAGGIDSVSVGRVMQGVIGGIGFLGAGAIIKSGSDKDVRGSATGAGIWVVGGIGMAIGFGLYLYGILAALVAIVIFVAFGALREEVDEKTDDMNGKK